MLEDLHPLLQRQIRRSVGKSADVTRELNGLIELVNEAYKQFDADREMLERSLDLSSDELIEANSEMRAAFERIVSSSIDGILAWNFSLQVTVWNPGMVKITGIPVEHAVGRPVVEIFPALGDSGDDPALRETLQGKSTIARESIYSVASSDEAVFLENHYSPLKNEEGDVIGGLAIVRNITERKVAEQALAELSIRDPLTNLYNRRHFGQRLEEEMSRSDRMGRVLAILLCDLDNFKQVNASRGHHFGDQVLKTVAHGIRDATRGVDLVFRWSGDEFVVTLLSDDRKGIHDAVERIRRTVVAIGNDMDCPLDISTGVALYPDHGNDPGKLVRLADRARYIAKRHGDRFHIGEEEYELHPKVVDTVFQPIVDISTGNTVAHEALSRSPNGKLSVLELFAKYEAIGQLSALKRICFDNQILASKSAGLTRVFVNTDFALLEEMEHATKPDDMEVVLEFSEKEALHDLENHLRVAEDWRQKGFKLAIDDFGAGFISLPFIARLKPEYIKIDRLTILQAVESAVFLEFLNDLVKALENFTTEGIIAEGIETPEELDVVRRTGIRLVQGFLLGRPMPLGSDQPEGGTIRV